MMHDALVSERIQIHPEGPELSRLIWGSMRSLSQFASARELADFLLFLFDHGVTTVDTADIYGTYKVEAFLGEALKLMGNERTRVEIVTKAGIALISESRPENRMKYYDSSADYLMAELENSLKVLNIEAVDLWLVHRPDPLMDAAETAHALDRAILSGKARGVGVSNFRPSQVELLAAQLKTTLRTNQIEFSPLHLDPLNDGSLDIAQRLHFHPQVWSPVGGGRLLTGEDERTVRTRNKLAEVAKTLGLSGPAEAALAWVARHPSRPLPILGSGKRERVEGALAALNAGMDRQTWYDIWRTSIGEPVP